MWGILDPHNEYRKRGYSAKDSILINAHLTDSWEASPGEQEDEPIKADKVVWKVWPKPFNWKLETWHANMKICQPSNITSTSSIAHGHFNQHHKEPSKDERTERIWRKEETYIGVIRALQLGVGSTRVDYTEKGRLGTLQNRLPESQHDETQGFIPSPNNRWVYLHSRWCPHFHNALFVKLISSDRHTERTPPLSVLPVSRKSIQVHLHVLRSHKRTGNFWTWVKLHSLLDQVKTLL